MNDERRASRRLAIDVDTMYRKLSDSKDYTATMMNISFGGICIFSDEILDPHTRLEFRVSLETGEMVFLTAEVRWQEPRDQDTGKYKTGLKILEGRDNNQAQFERYYNLRVLYPPIEEENGLSGH